MSMHTHAIADAIKDAERHATAPFKHASDYLKGIADDAKYTRAQLRGERNIKKMRRDGTLKAKSPRKVIHLPK